MILHRSAVSLFILWEDCKLIQDRNRDLLPTSVCLKISGITMPVSGVREPQGAFTQFVSSVREAEETAGEAGEAAGEGLNCKVNLDESR